MVNCRWWGVGDDVAINLSRRESVLRVLRVQLQPTFTLLESIPSLLHVLANTSPRIQDEYTNFFGAFLQGCRERYAQAVSSL